MEQINDLELNDLNCENFTITLEEFAKDIDNHVFKKENSIKESLITKILKKIKLK